MVLTLDPGLLDAVVSHLEGCLPEEGVGFLVGPTGRAARFVPAENSLHSRTEFAVAPQFLFNLFRDLRDRGEELVAICHSHPSGPAVPSASDIASNHYPESASFIVSFEGGEPEVRAFRTVDGAVVDLELHVIV